MVFSALKLRDQRNSCHCGLTWNSGKCADDKIPACGYVPGLVWNEYLVPAHEDQQKRQNRFLSAQFKSAASTFHWMRNDQRGHSQGGGELLTLVSKLLWTFLQVWVFGFFFALYLKTWCEITWFCGDSPEGWFGFRSFWACVTWWIISYPTGWHGRLTRSSLGQIEALVFPVAPS